MARFEIYQLSAGDINELGMLFQKFLVKQSMKSSSPRYLPLLNTISHIASLNAVSALVQRDVQDPDFLAEHDAYYSKWSLKVPRFCIRLHFFNVSSNEDDVLNFIDEMKLAEDSYLGFVTLRPISLSPQAATILKPVNNGTQHYILSRDGFPVNIAGREFCVDGTPFMQQDNAVGACAQASIWMALRTLRRKEGHSAFSPAQITNAATRFLVKGRTLPNRGGLIIEQITEALRASGYAPHIIPLKDTNKPVTEESLFNTRKLLYPYIESGIPVLMILFPQGGEGHAVLLIGHGWKSDVSKLIKNWNIKISDEENITVYDASSWVEPLLIHNDNTGPYIPILDQEKGQYSLSDAAFAIPFLYPDVFVDAAEAKLACHRLLEESISELTLNLKDIKDAIKTPELVTRTYLQDRSDFRSKVFDSDMHDDVKSYYRQKWLPKRIWVMEVNLLEKYSDSPDGNAIRVGELLLDPASESEDGHFLAIHIGAGMIGLSPNNSGVIINRDPFNGKIDAFAVGGNKYSPIIRTCD